MRQVTVGSASLQLPFIDTWQDNRGNVLTFTVGVNPGALDYGRVSQIASSNGSAVSFSYNTAGLITTATANDGRAVGYSYNSAGELTAVHLPDGQTCSYQYSTATIDGLAHHLITQVNKPDGRILQNSYDVNGRVVQQKATVDHNNLSALVVNAAFDYSVAGQTTVLDAYNNPTVYSYSNNLITQIVDPLGHVLATTGTTEAGLAIADVDIPGGILAAYGLTQGANIIRDRRPETYRALSGSLPIAIDG